MTDFGLVQASPHQPDSTHSRFIAVPPDQPTGAVPLHARQFGCSPSCDFRHSARRVLQALPRLLYLKIYPNPLKNIARILSQYPIISRLSVRSGSAGNVSVELAHRKAHCSTSSGWGRPPSLESFNGIISTW